MKELLAKEIAKRINNNDVIGVGTGTTVEAALIEIGKKVKEEGWNISVVPSSRQSSWRCHELGFTVLDPIYIDEISWGFDGTDGINSKLQAIKGRGAAMLMEKILASKCKNFILIADDSKFSENIADLAPIPVEIIPDSLGVVQREIAKLNPLSIQQRWGEARGRTMPIITQQGNLILDVEFKEVPDTLENDLKLITGVVETGLFLTQATEAIIQTKTGLKFLKK